MNYRSRGAFFVAIVILIGTQIAIGAAKPVAAFAERKLFKNHRMLMALAAARGDKDLVVLIAARPGENARVAEEV
jgi:hypothetical protein